MSFIETLFFLDWCCRCCWLRVTILIRTEALENASILKTKAMREREELRYIQRYKFALVRVRFPDGVYLQGTFSVYEKLEQVYAFVQSCLKNESLEFKLMSPIGTKLEDDDKNKSLFDLRYVV